MCFRHDHPPYDQASMTTDDLARLRLEYDELASKATARPWDIDPLTGDGWAIVAPDDTEELTEWQIDGYGAGGFIRKPDAALIVWLRNNADALLDAAEASERLRAVEGHTHRRRHYCGQHHQFEEVHEYAVALPPVTKAELRAARAALATPPPATVDEPRCPDPDCGHAPHTFDCPDCVALEARTEEAER